MRYGQILKEHESRSDRILLTNWMLSIRKSVELRRASWILGSATRDMALLCAETRCTKGGIDLTGLWGDVALRYQEHPNGDACSYIHAEFWKEVLPDD